MSAIDDWRAIPARIEKEIRGVRNLDRAGASEGLSIRENVHHIVEANLIASNMILAALATDGGYFDWTWIWPDKSWMARVGYDKADIRPALAVLHALGDHVQSLLARRPEALTRKVRLADSPRGKRYAVSIEGILEREIEHAADHLEQIRAIRNERRRN